MRLTQQRGGYIQNGQLIPKTEVPDPMAMRRMIYCRQERLRRVAFQAIWPRVVRRLDADSVEMLLKTGLW